MMTKMSYDEWAEKMAAQEKIWVDILAERGRQDDKFGEQHHPDGTEDGIYQTTVADNARTWCQITANTGSVTWRDILNEEIQEAFAEVAPAKLRAELIQSAAVLVAWVEDIDSRGGK
jgi:hypothetical protein